MQSTQLDAELATATKQLELLKLRKQISSLEEDLSRGREPTAGNRGRQVSTGSSVADDGECRAHLVADVLRSVPLGEELRQAYRVVDFISARKQREAALSAARSGHQPARMAKPIAVESLTFGDWIAGNANAMLQMLTDGRLVRLKGGALDTSELVDLLKHIARVGDFFDLGFERARVMRYDDECRLLQATSGSWLTTAGDIGLVATHLMAPNRLEGGSRQARRRQAAAVCYDFNKPSGCSRTSCRFAHTCRRCGQPHPEFAHHSEEAEAPAKN
jgi:hypothetical protein